MNMRNYRNVTAHMTQHHGVQEQGVHIGNEGVVVGVTHNGLDVLRGEVVQIAEKDGVTTAWVQNYIYTKTTIISQCRRVQIGGPLVNEVVGNQVFNKKDINNLVQQFKIRLPMTAAEFGVKTA